MKERPILFNGEMVRAILDGRKSQTRRVINPQGAIIEPVGDVFRICNLNNKSLITMKEDIKCPYGQPGDRLWVRETFSEAFKRDEPASNGCVYKSDYLKPTQLDPGFSDHNTWKPSIHMPRWASRINLEITNVRVERVQDISEGDAESEGTPNIIPCLNDECDPEEGCCACDHTGKVRVGFGLISYKECFQSLWNSINEKRGFGWDLNPWVWVIEFKRIENEDD